MICQKEKCTGCFACYNICPKNAIKMVEDEHGYIYPEIDKEKCINCKLCEKICPSINKIEGKNPLKCYAMIAKDDNKRKASTSGGAATIFSEYILKQGGVVYGAAFKKGCTIEHTRIDKIEDLYKLKGSKYVHSYINEIYKTVKEDLNKKRKVLFTGTPCQIAGLKKYLLKDYENLYLIDIICHGVPSQKYLKDELSDANIDSLSFRDNKGFILKAKDNDTIIKEIEMPDSPYYWMFMNGYSYRENCYNCLYSNNKRCSDITIGDFWGLSENSKLYDKENRGVSVLLPITDKGIELINNCIDEIIIEERDINEAIKGNSQLRQSVEKNKNYNKFKKNYLKYGFNKAFEKTYKIKAIKQRLKRNKIINKIYTKIKGE